MGLVELTKQAFFRALSREDNMLRFAERTGVAYPIINRLKSGNSKFGKITLATFEKLFPELEATFFRDERVGASELSGYERKLLEQTRKLSEEGKMELLISAGALAERYSKNKDSAAIGRAG